MIGRRFPVKRTHKNTIILSTVKQIRIFQNLLQDQQINGIIQVAYFVLHHERIKID